MLLREITEPELGNYGYNISLAGRGLTKLPTDLPQTVAGYFSCQNNKLRSLKGSPLIVKSFFNCNENKLKTLVGGPSAVDGNYLCARNMLVSLEGAPRIVGENFVCNNNPKLTSLKDIHKYIGYISKYAYFDGSPIKSNVLGLLKIKSLQYVTIDQLTVQEIINKYLPLGDLLDCQEELIEAGFEEFAQL